MLSQAQLTAYRTAAEGMAPGPVKNAITALLNDADDTRAAIQALHDRIGEARRRVKIFHDAMKYQAKITPFRQERIRKELSRPL